MSAPPDHPGWFRTPRPLGVAVLGWADLSLQAAEGSGYNLSASELASGLALIGHRVHYLAAGRRYGIRPWMHLRRAGTWRAVECWDLVNSPNLSPAATNFRNMARELSCARETRTVLRWLDRIAADIVHIHSLEGFPIDLVGAIRDTGRPVVVTPHNYWYICPQVDLLQGGTRPCTDYDEGRACQRCVQAAPPWAARLGRRVEGSVRAAMGRTAAGLVRHAYRSARRRLGFRLDGLDPTSLTPPQPDPEAAQGFDPGGPEHPGTFDHGLRLLPAEKPPDVGASPLDQNERFLGLPFPLPVRNPNIYARRRLAGIAALNRASLVTPPSRFVLDTYVRMGLDRGRGRVVRLGQPHFDQIHRRVRRSPHYALRPWSPAAPRPCRFAFFGTVRPSKGLEVVARAVPLLPREVRSRCHFVIRAAGGDWVYRKRLSPFPEVSFLGGYDLLQLLAAGDEYDVGLLPHVWFENSPLVLLEHLHAGKLVVASRLGGPPEWLVEPPPPDPTDRPWPRHEGELRYNGLLVPAGDPSALAGAIARIVRGEVPLPSPREIHAVSSLRSYPDHLREVDACYRELIGGVEVGPGASAHGGPGPEAEPPLIETRRLQPTRARD